MAINSLSGYRPVRISGISSGMDTETLVTNMMKAQQLKLDKVYKDRTKLEWKRDAYNDAIKQTKDFRYKYMSVLSADNMFSTSIYQTNKINLPQNNFVDIVAKSNAAKLNYEIQSIKIAQSAKIQGNRGVSKYSGIEGATGTNMEAVTTGTKEFSAAAAGQQLVDLEFADGTKAFTFANADDKLSFNINGKDFVFEQTDTLQHVMDTVNADTTAKVTMSMDGNKIKFRSNEVGSGAQLSFANVGTANALFGEKGVFGIENSIKPTNAVNTSMTFEEFENATGKSFGFGGGSNSIVINGQSFSYDKSDTIDSFMQKVNAASGTTGVKMHYNELKDQFTFNSNSNAPITVSDGTGSFFGAASGVTSGTFSDIKQIKTSDSILVAAQKMGVDLQTDNGMLKFSINGKDFSFDVKTTSISAMTNTLNNDTDINISFAYSSISDSFSFSTKATGSDAKLEFANGTGSNAFGAGGLFGMSTMSASGTDAEMYITDGSTDAMGNKIYEKITSKSNTINIDGIEYKLKADMAAGSDDDNIKFNVVQDNTEVVAKVKSFIDEYNKILRSLTTSINEKKNYKYPPLSEEERKALSEKDLEQWEKNAKQGTLRNDTDISKLLTDLRSQLNVKIGDTGLSASDIGISIGTSVFSMTNEIEFNEEKFKAALEKNPDAVAQVMAASDPDKSIKTGADGYTRTSKNGLMSSISEITSNFERNLTKNALTSTNKSITETSDKMDDMVKKMYILEEKYYMQFARMEKLMAQYQAQGSWLGAQLGM